MANGSIAGRFGAIVCSAALFLAPFIALIYSPELGLFVMAAALLATAYLLREALHAVGPGSRRWLRVAIGVDVAVAIVCVVVLIWLLVGP
jgi:hypothetical protein